MPHTRLDLDLSTLDQFEPIELDRLFPAYRKAEKPRFYVRLVFISPSHQLKLPAK